MSKQTAVQWLTQRLHNRRNGIYDGHPYLSVQQLCEIALAMEREQIENAWLDSTLQFDNSAEMTYKKDFDQYYNETYGGNK